MGWAYNLAEKVLPVRLTQKIKVRGLGKNLASSAFTRHWLRAEEVPSFMGGPMPDDRMSAELTGALIEAKGSLTEITIGARSERAIPVTVPLPGAVLTWSATVTSRDLKLSATLIRGAVKWVEWTDSRGVDHYGSTFRPAAVDEGGEPEVLLPEVTLEAAHGAHQGRFIVPATGQVLLRFDNTYSYLTSKSVKYKFEVGSEKAAAVERAELFSQNVQLNF